MSKKKSKNTIDYKKIIIIILSLILLFTLIKACEKAGEDPVIKKSSTTTTTTTKKAKVFNGTVYDYFELKKSRSNADKFIKSMNQYFKDNDIDVILKYKKTTDENGRTFYEYVANEKTTISLIFNNKTKVLHCITIFINSDVYKNPNRQISASYEYHSIIEAAMMTANLYDECSEEPNCRLLTLYDTKVDNNYVYYLGNLKLEYSYIIAPQFVILNDDEY